LCRFWLNERKKNDPFFRYKDVAFEKCSTILYDCVAAFFTVRESFIQMQGLTDLNVTDDGMTTATFIDEKDTNVRCAMSWKDISCFRQYLVTVLTL
jgi:hypothetical protein